MGTFESSESLRQVLGGFFEFLTLQPEMAVKLMASRMIIRFSYREPELAITIDMTGDRPVITYNDQEKKPDVEMSMKADVAHRFWFGKVNLVVALARREMVAKGPIPKILKLLPVIKPAYELYPKYLEERGLGRYALS